MKIKLLLLCIVQTGLSLSTAYSQNKPQEDTNAELAKKLANPVANVISIPFQNNADYGIGPENGWRNTTNLQPVIPISINRNWNMITRVILPIITQSDISGPDTRENGLGDAQATLFFTPKKSKFVWAVGPAFLIPTGTNEYFASKKFGVGPSGLVLKQSGAWTYGMLANQIWSVAGSDERPDVSQMFLQPFLVHNWKTGLGVGINAEWTHNWESSTSTVWINPTCTYLTKLGSQKISFGLGPRLNVAAPDETKADWGWRAIVTLVFPE